MKRTVILGVAAAIAAVPSIAAAGLSIGSSDEADEEKVIGYFTDAGPLNQGADVRAAGAKVGMVDDISLQDGRARVALEVESSVLPLHQDARMTVRPVNLLGESYLELDAGSPNQEFAEDAEVPPERTEVAVGLQDVINAFDDPTSTGLAALLTTLGEGMNESGDEAAKAIKALAPAMRQSDELAGVLNDQNAVLNELVEQLSPVAEELAASEGAALDRLVESTDETMSTLAANHRELNSALAELPATVAESREALRELAGAADATTPTLEAIRPVTDNLSEITGELRQFADAADPALASLTPVLERADELLEQAAPAVSQLRKAGPDLAATAKNLRPVGDTLLDEHLGDLMEFVKKWSLSTNGRDELGHYFRGTLWVTPETLTDLAAAIGSPLDDDAPAEQTESNTATQDPTEIVPDLPSGTDEVGDSGSATGLRPEQEEAMLGQLLGGA
ncbi:phospholipid/cholesterol/gamma-HCH transport system substrate-binding protein [Haloechinothrix alba]|uniref:Phospholipid/cholesterol/gamma-HCH transport system substrate-binding protein n=1 Tax=Haloechinothrix alba TaxID=664784 RepID=A0A239A9M2_9PSEU|nr:MlaD family protein [Haloechinothrix alba]SNR92356.1 phospholipid/cholesterol/gamma-HCH transport system substrate-binding protein [Haloechinothrix alba]